MIVFINLLMDNNFELGFLVKNIFCMFIINEY